MQEATITEWLVSVGDRVDEGQALATVETDKVDGEIEAPAKGVISALLVNPGDEVAVGSVVATIDAQ